MEETEETGERERRVGGFAAHVARREAARESVAEREEEVVAGTPSGRKSTTRL